MNKKQKETAARLLQHMTKDSGYDYSYVRGEIFYRGDKEPLIDQKILSIISTKLNKKSDWRKIAQDFINSQSEEEENNSMTPKICGKCYYCRGRFIGDAHYCVHESNTVVESNNFVFQQVYANDSACVSYKSMAEQIKLGNVVSQSPKEFILVQDDSCHWYIIPFDKRDNWLEWLESDEIELGCVPSYAVSIGGSPSLVKFSEYIIGQD